MFQIASRRISRWLSGVQVLLTTLSLLAAALSLASCAAIRPATNDEILEHYRKIAFDRDHYARSLTTSKRDALDVEPYRLIRWDSPIRIAAFDGGGSKWYDDFLHDHLAQLSQLTNHQISVALESPNTLLVMDDDPFAKVLKYTPELSDIWCTSSCNLLSTMLYQSSL